MQIITNEISKMYTNFMLCLWLCFSVVAIATLSGANQQTEASSTKIIDGLPDKFIILDETLPEPHTREQSELLRDLQFVPSHIDFGSWSVGQARTQTVMLFNQHVNRTVHLNSVTGPSPVFYSSFFGSREVPPQGNTTFSIVFLPRQLGAISTDLRIYTSFGRADFEVRGEGTECPYRLKPLVGIKAPMNATLTPEIHMYNPHERPLQILEVYSSGGEFQLELPSGGSEGPQNLWEIPPHTLKPVIRISFHGRSAGNHSAYIRIKIAEQTDSAPLEDANDNILVIPVEFEILSQQASYARNPLADFGRLTTHVNEAVRIQLDMQSHNVDTTNHKLIGSYLRDIPGLTFDAHNASIVLDPKLFGKSATINDLLVIRSIPDADEKAQTEFTVLVRAEIFKGDLIFDRNVTTFVTGSDDGPFALGRSLVVRNGFEFPLALYNISLSEPIDPQLLMISPPIAPLKLLLQPGESVKLLQFYLDNEEATFKSTMRIQTNVTVFELPVIACNGKLHVSTQLFELRMPAKSNYEDELNLGTVPFAEMSREGYILLRNDNPMPIMIATWNFKPPKHVYFTAIFMGCMKSDSDFQLLVERNETITGFQFCREIAEGHTAIVQVSIKTYVAEQGTGTLKIWTPYELIKVTVRFRASVGQLDIDEESLNFKNCFPGKMCNAVLSIRSGLMHPVHITAVKFTKPGLRFKDFNAKGTTIAALSLTKVGRIAAEPATLCGNTCYIKQSDEEDLIFPTGSGNNNLLYNNIELRQRTERFRFFKRQLQSMSLTLYSEELPPLELEFSIDVEWPKLVETQRESYTPAIEVGRVQRQIVVISNPTPHAMLVDYFLSDPTYARRTKLSLPHEVIDVTSTNCYLTDQHVFSLPNGTPDSPILVPAMANISVLVEFKSPDQAEKYCTLLHIRNNITLYEAIWLTARSVQSQFRFGNRRPGSTTPLLFELSPDQFETCDGTSRFIKPTAENVGKSHTVMTTRTFTARNSGVSPISIEGFLIDNRPCEGFGFKVINCPRIELRENETRKIEIAFSPDFTMSRVMRSLTLVTNLTYDIKYMLLAQMPAESVARCSITLPRPTWEQLLRNASVTVLLVSFCLVLVAALIDCRTILVQQGVSHAARYKGTVQPTFNLRNIAKLQSEEPGAPATTAKLDTTQQQQKLKNCQFKDIRKRSTSSVTTTSSSGEKPIRKSKNWPPWQAYTNALSNQKSKILNTQPAVSDVPTKTVSPPITIPVPKPSSPPQEAKPNKKVVPLSQASMPVPQQPHPKLHQQQEAQQQQQSAQHQVPHQASHAVTTTRTQKKVKQPSVMLSKQKSDLQATPSAPLAVTEMHEKQAIVKTTVSQPENIYSRQTKSTPESPKERDQKVLKEQNGAIKKVGKTPGRERRKEQKTMQLNGSSNASVAAGNANKKSERKQRNKALNFYGNALATSSASPVVSPSASPDALKCITSPWETSSRVSFSDVLQTKQFPPIENGIKWNSPSNEVPTTQLGPIGSRKSNVQPSVTSLWEPLPLMTNATSENSHSLFDMPPVPSSKPNTFIAMDLPQSLLDHNIGDLGDIYERKQANTPWERSELIMQPQLMLNQAQQHKHQQQERQQMQQQNDLLQQHSQLGSNIRQNNWALNHQAPWSPLGYTSWQDLTPINNQNSFRTPPGLETNYSNNMHMPVTSSSSGLNRVDAIAQNMLAASSNAQQQAHMPTQYDPFTSPSSIWSDNWRQHQSQYSQKRNNHMN